MFPLQSSFSVFSLDDVFWDNGMSLRLATPARVSAAGHRSGRCRAPRQVRPKARLLALPRGHHGGGGRPPTLAHLCWGVGRGLGPGARAASSTPAAGSTQLRSLPAVMARQCVGELRRREQGGGARETGRDASTQLAGGSWELGQSNWN